MLCDHLEGWDREGGNMYSVELEEEQFRSSTLDLGRVGKKQG